MKHVVAFINCVACAVVCASVLLGAGVIFITARGDRRHDHDNHGSE